MATGQATPRGGAAEEPPAAKRTKRDPVALEIAQAMATEQAAPHGGAAEEPLAAKMTKSDPEALVG